MEHIEYSLSFLDGQQVSGKATKIVVRDAYNVMTLMSQCSPLITVLNSGKIEVYDTPTTVKEYLYQEGFLNASDNRCTVTILKY